MDISRKNVVVLAVCQGLLLINNTVLITVNALVGYALAPEKALATLPVTMYFVGSALSTIPFSFMMKRYGRRAGFTLGALFATFGSITCAVAVYRGDFWLLCLGVLVLGAYFAAGQYYRFAAADSAPADFKSTAISLVLAGGIVGGFIGPETSKLTKDLVAGHAYAGSYMSLVAFALLSIVALRWLQIAGLTEAERKAAGRPLEVIARQPAFIVAVLCATIAYGVMNLLMTTTPLAMDASGHHFREAAFVIQWHVVGMFAPSFVTGHIIKRFGLTAVMLTGVVLNIVCVGIALSGVQIMHFWLALVLLGIGWNFMFVGATALLTEIHSTAERAKVQGVNDAAISITMIITSLASGALFTIQGWYAMNLWALPALLLVGASLLWLAWTRRQRDQLV
ncbi:MAG TPA: MFS transporter [Burkholderiales bacterium]|nr:MFS transporter [Burkholderiales bacterium]